MKYFIKTFGIMLLITGLSWNIFGQQPDNYIKHNNSRIQYTGRIDFSNPEGPGFAYQATNIKAKFKGTAIDLVLDDHSIGGVEHINFYAIRIDGNEHKILEVNNSDTLYEAASGLGDREHVIEVFKRTEATVGESTFKGFVIPGDSLMSLPPKPNRKIEFIGDSWTAAYGNDTSIAAPSNGGDPNTGFHARNEDQWYSWGAIVSRRLGAQYHCTAISGRGVHRNNSGSTTGVIPDEFPRIFPGQTTPAWDFNRYQPDLVVSHLGSNDFFPETWSPPDTLDSAAYVNDYIQFIDTVRSKYPNTEIVVAFGSSKSDAWPAGMQQLTRWRRYTDAIVSHFNNNGDNMVSSFELATQTPPYGEDWHPDTTTHKEMAGEITPYLQNLMGWNGDSTDCTGELGGAAYEDDCGRCVGGNTGLTACSNPAGTQPGDIDINTSITIRPNPADSHVYISGERLRNIHWELTNNQGATLRKGKGTKVGMRGLPVGSYLLHIQHHQGSVTRKVVKK